MYNLTQFVAWKAYSCIKHSKKKKIFMYINAMKSEPLVL